MRIRKMYQGTLPKNKILSTYSDSQSDTYSCDYINNIGSGDNSGSGDSSGSSVSATILYDNSAGNTGTITLTDDVSNYNTVEVYYGELYNGVFYYVSMKKVPVINGIISVVPLEIVAANSNSSGMLIFTKIISISGKELTIPRELKITTLSSGNTFDTNANVGIFKIIGYK